MSDDRSTTELRTPGTRYPALIPLVSERAAVETEIDISRPMVDVDLDGD